MTKNPTNGQKALEELHHTHNKTQKLREIPVNDQGFVLLGLSRNARTKVLKELKDEEITELTHYLDPDDATDLLQLLGPTRRKRIIAQLNEDLRTKVEYLLKFNPTTAAGIMNLDYIDVEISSTFEEVLKILKCHEKKTGKFPTILVVKDGFPVGELPGYTVSIHKASAKIENYVRKIPKIRYNRNEKEVTQCFKKHRHNKVVVTNDDGSIMGVIYSDDILRLMRDEAQEGLYNFAGVSREEDALDSPLTKFKSRSRWLILSLFASFFVASVVNYFQDTISAFVLLAVYMPVITGIGGNAGTQTLAVVVRGMTLNEIGKKTGRKIIFNEMVAGIMNGALIGLAVALVAAGWHQNPLLGAVVGVSMVINLLMASFFGAVAPMALKHLGKDPATSSAVFITTLTDIFGFLVFLGLATLLLI